MPITTHLLHKAISLEKAGNQLDARRVLQGVLQQEPQNKTAWEWYVSTFTSDAEIIQALQELLIVFPEHHAARFRLQTLQQKVQLTKPPPPPEKAVEAPAIPAQALIPAPALVEVKSKSPSTFARVTKYIAVKSALLVVMVAVGILLTILVVNLGGYVDKVFKAMIDENIGAMIYGGWLKNEPEEKRAEIIEQTRWAMQEAYGLHQPFILRCFRWLLRGMALDLGATSTAYYYEIQHGEVREILLKRLPYTLVLVGASNLLFFIASLFVALYLSRRFGGLLDRLNILLSTITSPPSWIHGVILITILIKELHLLPFPRILDLTPEETSFRYYEIIAQQMILPVIAIFFSMFFQSVYAWRTFFLIYAEEEYVEIAKAKGLPNRILERSYIMRPALPYIFTNFATMMIGVWQGAIALELLFVWPGIGIIFIQALRSFNTGLILGIVVIFAYLLAITVLLMDIFYALVDPRVRIGNDSQTLRAAPSRAKRSFLRRWARDKMEPQAQRGVVYHATQRKEHQEQIGDPPNPRLSASIGRSIKKRSFKTRFSIPKNNSSVWKNTCREIRRYPSAILGLVIITAMILISIYAVIAIPPAQAIELWRAQGGDWYRNNWYRNPQYAFPAWVNIFRKDKLPETIIMSSSDGTAPKEVSVNEKGTIHITIPFEFQYPYGGLPQDIVIYMDSVYKEKLPFVTLTWQTPDGRELDLGSFSLKTSHDAYYLSRDQRVQRKLKGQPILPALFTDPLYGPDVTLKGTYCLKLDVFLFEADAKLEAEFLLYGQVHGLAGTDNYRRDLSLALLWGAPVALSFGLLGALFTSFLSMLLAAAGAWFSGWVDHLIQRITEINMVIPALPIATLVYLMYSKSIWAILGVIVLLSVFGSSIKNYRAVFMQVKEAPYIEAARAYGASNWRIIRHYLLPRILPVLAPQLVVMIPGYVFYEATFAYLGVSDPYLPTWGKVIYDALLKNALQDYPYWILEPIVLLILTALAFAMLGLALDRILNPKLRTI